MRIETVIYSRSLALTEVLLGQYFHHLLFGLNFLQGVEIDVQVGLGSPESPSRDRTACRNEHPASEAVLTYVQVAVKLDLYLRPNTGHPECKASAHEVLQLCPIRSRGVDHNGHQAGVDSDPTSNSDAAAALADDLRKEEPGIANTTGAVRDRSSF
ncbi:MAG TPA: hypothetical protein VKM54_23110 [Myxococcota bacterium]|nr:hypothetical protein [Myxococcota bacterium]